MTRQAMALFIRALCALVIASVAWITLGYLATAPLGLIFGWSGHPSIPNAPAAVYVGLYLVLLPVLCLVGAWKLLGWLVGRVNRAKTMDQQ
jgi:hypothetical protein